MGAAWPQASPCSAVTAVPAAVRERYLHGHCNDGHCSNGRQTAGSSTNRSRPPPEKQGSDDATTAAVAISSSFFFASSSSSSSSAPKGLLPPTPQRIGTSLRWSQSETRCYRRSRPHVRGHPRLLPPSADAAAERSAAEVKRNQTSAAE